jgi:hypothetical protein
MIVRRLLLVLFVLVVVAPVASAQLMIVGLDEKVTWDEAGKITFLAPGKDSVVIASTSPTREAPRIVATLPPPYLTWGGMLSLAGLDHMYQAPWLAIWPAVALSLAVFGFNMLGDALRDLLDPRLKGS